MKKRPRPTPISVIPLLIADVFQLSGALRRWGDRIASTVGQTQARWQVLSAASEGNMTVPRIARRLGQARQSVQRTADLLVADGVAEYANNRDHRWSPCLSVTREGAEVLDQLTRVARAYHVELAEGLDLEEIQTAFVVIRKFCIQTERDLLLKPDQTDNRRDTSSV